MRQFGRPAPVFPLPLPPSQRAQRVIGLGLQREARVIQELGQLPVEARPLLAMHPGRMLQPAPEAIPIAGA